MDKIAIYGLVGALAAGGHSRPDELLASGDKGQITLFLRRSKCASSFVMMKGIL